MPKRKQPKEEEEAVQRSEEEDSSSSDASSDDFPSGAEESSESSDDEAGQAFEQVDVDFGFYCPRETDYQGLQTLLQNFLDGKQWACSQLVEIILQQASLGQGVHGDRLV